MCHCDISSLPLCGYPLNLSGLGSTKLWHRDQYGSNDYVLIRPNSLETLRMIDFLLYWCRSYHWFFEHPEQNKLLSIRLILILSIYHWFTKVVLQSINGVLIFLLLFLVLSHEFSHMGKKMFKNEWIGRYIPPVMLIHINNKMKPFHTKFMLTLWPLSQK